MSGGGSSIGSIGSATSSNLAGVGPSLNVTANANMTISAKLGSSAREMLDGVVDFDRHELCMRMRSKTKCAYVPVVSTDTIEAPESVAAHSDSTDLPHNLAGTMLDMSMGSYYREVADARTQLEYCLRKNQISLHSFDETSQMNLKAFQDHLNCKLTSTHPRHSIIFGTKNDFTDSSHTTKIHGSVWTLEPEATLQDIYVYKLKGKSDVMSQTIHGIVLEPTSPADDGNTASPTPVIAEGAFMMVLVHLEALIRHFSTYTTKVHNKNSNNKDLIEAPELSYAGIALLQACLHPQKGDTAVTLNIFSALTVNNGPFDVQCSDDLMWISSVELPDFEKDGQRRFRPTLDLQYLKMCLQPDKTLLIDAYKKNANTAARKQIVDALKHKPGNPSRKTFLIAPQKRGFGILRWSSIQDKMRHIGVAISSCHASKRLDMMKGACAKF